MDKSSKSFFCLQNYFATTLKLLFDLKIADFKLL